LKLHLNKVLFSEAIQFTSQEINLKPEYIEKDYWVTLALYTIFNHEIGNDMVFKGGTALSKCYQFIQRFSEDIDLVVLRREGESSTMLSKKIKQISSLVNAVIPEINVDGITRKKGLNRKLHIPI
jgi:predicted nucleotidyltransferase component of viral defense system